ncbi:MAG: glycosyl hydrolase family 28-related protein, partial [Ginsengibacter sp.]
MKIKIAFYCVLYFMITGCSVATKVQNDDSNSSKLFEQYKNDKGNSILPDFSYVGYHNGNKPIPNNLNYKVFNVTDFGAIPDDAISDKVAIQKAIDAANKNGSGIVFFPKGKFLVNQPGDGNSSITSKGSHIIFRGSGSGVGGTELYMKNNLPPKNPEQMWTVPPLFIFTSGGKDQKIGTVNASAKKGDFTLKLSSATKLKKGDWILLKMLNNDPALIEKELAPHHADPSWTSLVKDGVDFKIYYQVAKVDGNTIELEAPIPCDVDPKYNWEVFSFANSEEVGIENIAFTGNWKDKFVHHRSWMDDSGFTIFKFSRCTNSWMKDCVFKDCSIAATISQSAN